MSTDQDHPLEFLAELALGVLPESDAPAIRDHLSTCDSCRTEYETMERAALLLPYAVEDTEPGPQVRESLM
jgi:predicted anti-sigma-YlaC factor YlaD